MRTAQPHNTVWLMGTAARGITISLIRAAVGAVLYRSEQDFPTPHILNPLFVEDLWDDLTSFEERHES